MTESQRPVGKNKILLDLSILKHTFTNRAELTYNCHFHLSLCHHCGVENPDQAFCGACGSPLALNDYIAKQVSERLTEAVRDRDFLETESAIRVFQRAWGWLEKIGKLGVAVLAVIVGFLFWQYRDWRSAITAARNSVVTTAKKSRAAIQAASTRAVVNIDNAAGNATKTIELASANTIKQAHNTSLVAAQTRSQISHEASKFRAELDSSRTQLQAAAKLEPQVSKMRDDLAKAMEAVRNQQKLISSSEAFAKKIFSSHVSYAFDLNKVPSNRFYIVTREKGDKNSLLFLLLPSVPISQTVQLQYYIYTQPPNSYQLIKNLLIFSWGDPPENLKKRALSVSYFPDLSEKPFKALIARNGILFVDNKALIKLQR